MGEPVIKRISEATATSCPCGEATRILTGADNAKLSVHHVRISKDSKTHFHRTLSETYYVLEGTGVIELDGREEPLEPGVIVHIPPGVAHRAVGNLTILNIVVPPFVPEDEHLVD